MAALGEVRYWIVLWIDRLSFHHFDLLYFLLYGDGTLDSFTSSALLEWPPFDRSGGGGNSKRAEQSCKDRLGTNVHDHTWLFSGCFTLYHVVLLGESLLRFAPESAQGVLHRPSSFLLDSVFIITASFPLWPSIVYYILQRHWLSAD